MGKWSDLATQAPSSGKWSALVGGPQDDVMIQVEPEDLEWRDVLTGAVKSLPASGYEFGKNIATALIHPVQTGKALGKTAMGVGQKLIPGEQEEEQYIDALIKDFKEAYGSVEGFKRTIAEDPVRVLADIASVITLAGTAVRGAGTVSRVGKIAGIGKAVSKAGISLEPTAVAAKLISQPFKLIPEKVPIHLYQSAVKFGTTLPIKERVAVARTAVSAKNQIMPTVKGLTKLRRMIDDYNETIGKIIDESTKKGEQINIGRFYAGLDKIKDKIKATSDEPLKVESAFKNIKKQWKEAIKTGPLRTPDEAQKLKQRIYRELQSYYEKHKATPAKTEIRKAIARNARKLIEEIIPEIKQLNQKEGALIELWDAVESKASRITNRDIISIGLPIKMGTGAGIGFMFAGQTGGTVGTILGFMLGIFDTPQVKAKIALVLNKLREKGITIKPTMSGVNLGLYQSMKMRPEKEAG